MSIREQCLKLWKDYKNGLITLAKLEEETMKMMDKDYVEIHLPPPKTNFMDKSSQDDQTAEEFFNGKVVET